MAINPAVRTKLGGDYPLSDEQVSELMDAQVKPSAAVGLQQAEVCWLPPPSGMICSNESLQFG